MGKNGVEALILQQLKPTYLRDEGYSLRVLETVNKKFNGDKPMHDGCKAASESFASYERNHREEQATSALKCLL